MADAPVAVPMTYAHFETDDNAVVRLVDSASADGYCQMFVGPAGAVLDVHDAQHLLCGLAEWLHDRHPDAGLESEIWEQLRVEIGHEGAAGDSEVPRG